MGLSNLPEWARKKPDEDPLEAAVKTQVDRISAAIADATDKRFTVSKADDRVVVSMYREGQDPEVVSDSLFTVSDVGDGEYMIADVGAKANDLPIFVGPLSETLDIVRKEITGTYLESWERPDPAALEEPSASGDDIEVRPLTDEELDRLFNLPDGPPPPPGVN